VSEDQGDPQQEAPGSGQGASTPSGASPRPAPGSGPGPRPGPASSQGAKRPGPPSSPARRPGKGSGVHPAPGSGAGGPSKGPPGAFVTRLRVRFHEIDRAGIAYFARSFQYCHEAFEDMLSRALKTDLERFFRESTWMLPLVHAESDYAAPIVLGQDLRIELRVAHLGKSSVVFSYRVVGEPDGVERAKVKLVHACVEREGFRKRPLPPPLIAGFKALGLIK